jgi:hypothetical protein
LQADPSPRRLEVDRLAVPLDLRGSQHPLDDARHELLGERHHAVVVGAADEPLEHRELGVVLGRHPLVAEEPAQLVDVLEAADDHALQVQLGRDPQEEVAVERVVMGLEGARRGAAGEPLQDRRLQLDVAAFVHVLADRGEDLRPQGEDLARALVRHQVELALPVAGLDVGDAVEEVGRVAQRLGEQHALADAERKLAPLGHVEVALHTDHVADVEILDALVGLLAEVVEAGVGLDRAGEVADVEEGRLAVDALAGHAAGDAVGPLAVIARPQLLRVVGGVDRGDLRAVGEGAREGIDAFGAQPLQLGAPLGLGRARRGRGRHRGVTHRSRAPNALKARRRLLPAHHPCSRA